MKKIYLAIILLLLVYVLKSQNIAITDDDTYTANPSAMLDVKSLSKGMLVPRLTTVQRNAVSSPATGLLVFDTDAESFYFFNGTSWINLTSGNASGILSYTSPDKIYLSDINDKFGVGTISPTGKMEVKSDVSIGNEKPIFNVVNSTGDTVFAVYEQGVRINVYDDPLVKASGSKGGFAVGGFSPAKGTSTNEYLRITPDSIRLYVEDVPVAKASGSKGGFAVGGFSPAKVGLTNEYLRVTSDSTRIYTSDTVTGFAAKSISGSTKTSYMKLTPKNYFIGHESGNSISTGLYNSLIGFQSGKSLTSGLNNTFFGYQAGISGTICNNNLFLGYRSGYSNISGGNNIFLGKESGYSNISGADNMFLGYQCGYSNTNGDKNFFSGYQSGYANTTGNGNLFLGYQSGLSNINGNDNTFIGNYAGLLNVSGTSNMFIGQGAGLSNTGSYNMAIGAYSGYNNAEGEFNLFIGQWAGYDNIDGYYNIAIGASCSQNNLSGANNTYIGVQAAQQCGGSNNTFMGRQSGYNKTTGSANSYFGLYSGWGNNGDNNTYIGTQSGQFATGSDNVFLGNRSGMSTTASGVLYIANNSGTPLIYGDFSQKKVGITTVSPASNLDVYVTGNDGDAGIGITKSGGKHLTINQGTNGNLNFTEPGVSDLFTLNFNTQCVGIANPTPIYPLHMASGAYCSVGGTWTNSSDKNLKENFKEVNCSEILEKINTIPVTIWNYKTENKNILHIGPMAQDFYRIFGFGNDSTSISTIDPMGISFAAIKELNKKIISLEKYNDNLKTEIKTLKTSNNNYQSQIEELNTHLKKFEAENNSIKTEIEKIKSTLELTGRK